MAYLVLARKYRPQRFSDVIGQDHVTRTLINALTQGRIAHGYIFSGHRGIGKTTIARILAMALNCRTAVGSPERPTAEPCGICDSCTEVRAGNSTDVIEIDAATNRGIDEIRELRDAARYRPSRDKYKIYILDEAHQITDAAFNALLKTLEEPPDHVIFMMATTQPEDIPQTIRSRCQHFSFHAVSFEQITEQLTSIAAHESIHVEDAALGLLAEAGDGSMRDALSIMDQAIASAPLDPDGKPRLNAEQIRELMGNVPSNVFEQVLEAVSVNNSSALLLEVNSLLNAGHSPQQLARQMVRYLRNVLMVKLAGDATELLQVSSDERKRAARTAMLFGEEDLTRFLQLMLRTFDDLGYRQEQRFHFELGLLKLVHAQRLLPLEQMLSANIPNAARAPVPAPRPPASSGASAPGPATNETAAPPPRAVSRPRATTEPTAEPPGFSPFEQDRRRKEPTASVAQPDAVAPAPRPVVTMQAPPAAAAPLKSVLGSSAETQRTAGALALAQELQVSPVTENEAAAQPSLVRPDPIATMSPAVGVPAASVPAASVQEAILQALADAGQDSAVNFLSAAEWAATEREWKVGVAVADKMLSIAINPEVRKLAERIVRESGTQPSRITFIATGAASSASRATRTSAALPLPAGGVRQLANENELVQKARDLFQAEIRDVVDLRQR